MPYAAPGLVRSSPTNQSPPQPTRRNAARGIGDDRAAQSEKINGHAGGSGRYVVLCIGLPYCALVFSCSLVTPAYNAHLNASRTHFDVPASGPETKSCRGLRSKAGQGDLKRLAQKILARPIALAHRH